MTEVNEKNAAQIARVLKDGVLVGPSTVRRSPTFGAIALALLKCQGELKNPPKTAENPHFKSRFADLATVRETVLPVFTRHGLALLQLPCEVDGDPALTTLLVHAASGEWVETVQRTRPTKGDPQSAGSALTYARRYALQTVAGVTAEDDDDGNAGSKAPEGVDLKKWFADALADAQSREAITPLWRRYEWAKEMGILRPADTKPIEASFSAAAAKFPKPPEPAKKA
jgi:hypothetical protein